ncbi:MAG: hypothetical protein GC206_07840 [Alphaproteobacteria bacterium]|nr:hypothetical protein [Alphaproteobacteria bacterium]
MNSGGWRIGTFAGAPVIMDWSVLILAGYVVLVRLSDGGEGALVGALAFVAAIFAAILLHEFGHAWTAQRLNLQSKQIVLTFLGGHVEFERPPDTRWHNIAVSAAGPFANLAAFALLYFGLNALGGLAAPDAPRLATQPLPFLPPLIVPADWFEAQILSAFLAAFLAINLMLGVFNLLPGFPLDGGRILAAALSYTMHPARARIAAAVCGIVIAAGAAYYGLVNGFIWTMMVAAILALAALAEIGMARRALAANQESGGRSNT